MATIDSLNTASATVPPATGASASSSSGELAKCESQLSDWVHCPSSKTAAGKAKIAEITTKIDAIKARMKTSDDAKAAATGATHAAPAKVEPALRFDGLGAWLNAHA